MELAKQPLVTIFGGSGFVGTQLVQLFARKGFRVRIAVRRPDLAGHLPVLGTVGQIIPVQANVRNADSVRRAMSGAEIAVNLVGVGVEQGKQTFADVNGLGAATIAQAAREARVKTLLHVSAIGADPESPSLYARTKAAGEAAMFEAFPNAMVFRPSLMFGKDDGFFNLMGSLARLFPVMPLISGKTRFQPVFVGDVVEAIAKAADGVGKRGTIYELGGPEVLTQRELLGRILHETGRSNPLLPLPPFVAKLMAAPLAILPFRPFITSDQVTLLGIDNIVSDAARAENRTLAAFGISPMPMDAILPTYMWRFKKHGQFDRYTSDGTTV
jgi:uncharacterized protein YbjT (DUF2867 family)